MFFRTLWLCRTQFKAGRCNMTPRLVNAINGPLPVAAQPILNGKKALWLKTGGAIAHTKFLISHAIAVKLSLPSISAEPTMTDYSFNWWFAQLVAYRPAKPSTCNLTGMN